jgi:hypothetical protein
VLRLSSLLLNIYLHVLGEYIARYIKEFNVGIYRPHSSEYKKVAQKLGLTLTDTLSDAFKQMKYVRYAGGFIVRLTCSRTQVLVIKLHIKIFLQNQLRLELNDSKTLLTDTAPIKHFNITSQAHFLGYLFFMHNSIVTQTANNRCRRTGKGHVVFKTDPLKVTHKLAKKGFLH